MFNLTLAYIDTTGRRVLYGIVRNEVGVPREIVRNEVAVP